jgi:hypothetical protein
MKTKNKQQKKQPLQPVIDGDARPDQIPAGENSAAAKNGNRTKNKVSANRDGDINSLEDFRDAK